MYKSRILIVEDDFVIYTTVRMWLEHLGYYVPDQANKYTEAIDMIDKDPYDLAILDVNLSGTKSGIEVAQYINQKYDFPFIFLSSFFDEELLEKITDTNPSGYLLKPVRQEDLFSAISIALSKHNQRKSICTANNTNGKNFITIKKGNKYVRIFVDEILYIKSNHIYIDIHCKEGKSYIIRSSLQKYAELLPPHFAQVHRGFIINMNEISEFDSNSITIEKTVIPISNSYRENIMNKLKGTSDKI